MMLHQTQPRHWISCFHGKVTYCLHRKIRFFSGYSRMRTDSVCPLSHASGFIVLCVSLDISKLSTHLHYPPLCDQYNGNRVTQVIWKKLTTSKPKQNTTKRALWAYFWDTFYYKLMANREVKRNGKSSGALHDAITAVPHLLHHFLSCCQKDHTLWSPNWLSHLTRFLSTLYSVCGLIKNRTAFLHFKIKFLIIHDLMVK